MTGKGNDREIEPLSGSRVPTAAIACRGVVVRIYGLGSRLMPPVAIVFAVLAMLAGDNPDSMHEPEMAARVANALDAFELVVSCMLAAAIWVLRDWPECNTRPSLGREDSPYSNK